MEDAPFDSSGTDDDLPPSHHNRGTRGHITGNGRAIGALPYSRSQIDMEFQTHLLEQEAYFSVLRAFRAQADAISWDKNDLLTNLRRELRISDDEYSEIKGRVDADDVFRRIREWRQAGGVSQSGLLNNALPYDSLASPTISASRKRQKTSHSIPSLPMGAPSSLLHTQPVAAPSSSAALRGVSSGAKIKKPKPGHSLTGVSTMKSLQIPSSGPSGMGQVVTNRSTFAEPGGTATHDPLIGRKVKTRWPDDNNFYDAVITEYREGLHALVYDRFTDNETWEWVNLKEISPEDIKWEGEDPSIFNRTGRSGSVGTKKPTDQSAPTTGTGRGRGSLKTDLLPSTNGLGKKRPDDIEILHTETLIKEVEKIIAASHPDPIEIEKAKKVLKEHEQSLIDVIARLADASDGESEEHEDGEGHRRWNQHGANYVDSVGV